MADKAKEIEAMEAYQTGRYKTAIPLFQNLLKQDPNDWTMWVYLGMTYFRDNQLEPALKVMQNVAERCPDANTRKSIYPLIVQIQERLDFRTKHQT